MSIEVEKRDAKKIARASLASLLLAAVLLVTAVLPAEYGWDPLGTGELFGLTGFSNAALNPLQHSQEQLHSDEIEFVLSPFESVEYKYRMEEGENVVFQWRASAEVLSEMHAEPDGAAPGFAESFSKQRSLGESGSYRAHYGGIHGWFWQNRGDAELTLRLRTEGFFAQAIEYRDGGSFIYQFSKTEGKTQP
jgi:hypothetical protein